MTGPKRGWYVATPRRDGTFEKLSRRYVNRSAADVFLELAKKSGHAEAVILCDLVKEKAT